jgi:hypothetical protein
MAIVNPEQDQEQEVKQTPAQIMAEMFEIRLEKAQLKEREKQLNEVWYALESQLMSMADELGMKRMGVDGLGTATVTETVVPVVEDWDSVHQYILENEAPHLLQRRVAAAAFRELQDMGVDVPGLSPYTKRAISLRKTR